MAKEEKTVKQSVNDGVGVFDYSFVDAAKTDNKAVLCTLQGYATLSGSKDNRNKHFYPGRSKDGVQDSFWDRVLQDNTVVKEKLDTKTFYGSCRHPLQGENPVPEYGDTKVPISHAVRDIKIDDKGVFVVLDVLDTPAGREVKTFADYGSKIGISTRAFGEIEEVEKGYKTPTLDSYSFVTWDLVTFPAFSDTRMSKISDSVDFGETIADGDKDAFIAGLRKLPRAEAQSLCDYAGLDTVEVLGAEDNVSESEKALDDAISKILDLEKVVDSLQSGEKDNKEIVVLQDSLQELNSEKVKLVSDMEKVSNERRSLKDSLAIEKSRFDRLSSLYKAKKDTTLQMSDKVAGLEYKLTYLRDELKKVNLLKDQLKVALKEERENRNTEEEKTKVNDASATAPVERSQPLLVPSPETDKSEPVTDSDISLITLIGKTGGVLK